MIGREEAGFLARIAINGPRSGIARRAYSDWRAERNRPEWYVVHYDEPPHWLVPSDVRGCPDGRLRAEYRLPWLAAGIRGVGWV